MAQPHFIQASENYPAGPTISYYENRARGKGASIILLHDLTDQTQRDMPLDIGHFSMYDNDDKGAQNGFAHFVGCMHMHGTFAGCAAEFYMIGDCTQAASMRHAIKDAYCTAQQI